MKYIVGDMGPLELTTAVLFHEGIEHRAFKDQFSCIHSAGFCKIYTGVGGQTMVRVHGESIGLGVVSNPERDEKIIKRLIDG